LIAKPFFIQINGWGVIVNNDQGQLIEPLLVSNGFGLRDEVVSYTLTSPGRVNSKELTETILMVPYRSGG
jgi:hypothetical protein